MARFGIASSPIAASPISGALDAFLSVVLSATEAQDVAAAVVSVLTTINLAATEAQDVAAAIVAIQDRLALIGSIEIYAALNAQGVDVEALFSGDSEIVLNRLVA